MVDPTPPVSVALKFPVSGSDPTIKERTNITDERTGWTGNTYATTLSLKNAQYLDVGFITCSHEDNESEKAQTYLFVDDPTHLLLPMDPKPVIVSQYNSVLIPCRPTSEDVSVVLNKDSTPLDLDFADISFDPTEGFLIRSAVFEKHHGLFTCFATHPSGSKESKTFVLMVKVGGITLDPPKIDASNAEFVVLGQSLRLSCFADVERHVVPHMAWEWPNKNAENEGRIDLSPLTEDTSFPSRRTLRMNLTVRAVTEQDEGRYTCRIGDSTGNMQSDAVYMNDFHRGKYKIDTSDKRTILIVYNIKLEDFGEYLLVGQVGDKQEQLTVIMQVDSAPVLTLSGQSDDDYYSINQQYTFRCAVEAYPEPNITWRYRKCSEPYLCSSSFVEILEPGYNGETVHPITNATPFNSESVLTVTARESGYYQCSAENREGSADEDINFVVTEVPGGLGFLDAPNGQLTEGFVFNLTCAASRKNYTDEMLWYFKGEGQQDPFILESGAGWLVHQSNSKYSFYSTIRQEKLIMKHAGVYTCAVQKIGATEKENVEVTLDIKPIILPKLNAMSNMIPGVTDQITLEQGDPLTLNCTVDSNPPAEITWMKDGRPLELDESARRVFFLDTEPSRQVLFFQYTLSEHDPGFYTCLADNKKGVTEGQVTLAVTGGGKDAKMGTGYVILVAALGGFILILLPVLIWYYRKWKVAERKLLSKEEENQMRFGNKEDIDFNEEVGGQASNLPISNEFEFPEKNLVIRKALLILEYCPFGSLEEYLKKHQKHFIDELDVETGQLRSSVSEDLRSPRGRYALAKEREALAGARQGGSRFSTGSTGYVSNNGTSDVDRVPPLRSHGQRIVSTASETANLLTSDDEGYAVWARLYVDERDGSQVHISTTDLLSWAYQHLSELSEPYRSAHQVTDEGSTRRHTSRTSRLSSGGGNALPRIIETAPEPPTTDDGYIIPSPRTAPLAEEETVSVPLRDQIRAFPYRSYPPRYSQLGNQESMTEENEMREYANTTPSPERNSTAHYQTPRSNPVPLSSSPPPDYNAGVDYRFPVPQRAPSSSSSNSSGIHSHSEDEGRADEDASPPPSRSMSPGKRAPSYSRVAEHQV
ncbi:unnamed protein product [Cyprideis torosa]|uniref:Ig-like domain-containing protein n=1 Tax=Cyprideis torosa TaxID=163714 RepID=A0A7R8WAG3_9CRUS|nr:unnamed protein product [Cyprideis torosa]CAG0890942.1 unnamed protein product [Cyprideis torosa]